MWNKHIIKKTKKWRKPFFCLSMSVHTNGANILRLISQIITHLWILGVDNRAVWICAMRRNAVSSQAVFVL